MDPLLGNWVRLSEGLWSPCEPGVPSSVLALSEQACSSRPIESASGPRKNARGQTSDLQLAGPRQGRGRERDQGHDATWRLAHMTTLGGPRASGGRDGTCSKGCCLAVSAFG